MSNYKIVNPQIEGDVKTTFSGTSALDAANKCWSSLSKYISNNVPTFAFTLQNSKDGSLSHFSVKETKKGKEASFNISTLKLDLDARKEKEFLKRIKTQAGGKKHRKHGDDDDSSSSSSSDVKGIISPWSPVGLYSPYATNSLPITYWWYDPYVYNFDSLFIPTFVYPLAPYVEVVSMSYYAY